MARKKPLIGLDIGTNGIKFCQLKQGKRNYQLVNFGLALLPPETIVDGALIASDTIVDTLRELFDAHRVRGREVAISVSGHSVIIRKIALPPMTQEAIKSACLSAHRHITQTAGNVGEWSKKTDCWESFRSQEVSVPAAWGDEWAELPFVESVSSADTIAQAWESVRCHFLSDNRTLGELEALTGKQWVARYRDDVIHKYAVCEWSELKGPGGRRLKNLSDLVELLSTAADLDRESSDSFPSTTR